MPLERLHIENFQSIKDVTVDFGKFTVLVGKSNSGKSAILRALHVLVYNSFVPHYVRQGTTNTTLTATFDDGVVTTKRGKESTYVLTQETDEIYTKCGRAVPDDVVKFLRLPLLVDENLNFTNQFELPFLVGGKSSRASAVVGTITNAVMVNSLAQETNRRRLGLRSKVSVREGDLKALQDDLKAFDSLPELEQALERLQTLETSLNAMKHTQSQIQELLGKVEATQAKVVEIPCLPHIDPGVFTKLQKLEQAREWLTDFLERVSRIEQSRGVVPRLPEIAVSEFDTVQELTKMREGLIGQAHAIQTAQRRVVDTATGLAQAEDSVLELRKELESIPMCKACGQPII